MNLLTYNQVRLICPLLLFIEDRPKILDQHVSHTSILTLLNHFYNFICFELKLKGKRKFTKFQVSIYYAGRSVHYWNVQPIPVLLLWGLAGAILN